MSYQKRKSNDNNPFVMLYKDILQSDAWKRLNNPARVAYLHMKAKVYKKNQKEITLSYKEMEPFMRPKNFQQSH